MADGSVPETASSSAVTAPAQAIGASGLAAVGQAIATAIYQILLTLPFLAIGAGLGWVLGALWSSAFWRVVVAIPGSLFVVSVSGLTQIENRYDVIRVLAGWVCFLAWLFFVH